MLLFMLHMFLCIILNYTFFCYFTEVVNKLAGGIKEMVTGISSGNWQATILAGLSIVGTVAALAGPVGAAVAAVLTIISTIIGLFSGTQAVGSNPFFFLNELIFLLLS